MEVTRGLHVIVEVEVTDMPRFKAAAARCCELSRSEPGTTIYDWFVDERTGRARLIEGYASTAGLITHATGPVTTEVGPELMQTCAFLHMDVLGGAGALTDRAMPWPTSYWGEPFASLTS